MSNNGKGTPGNRDWVDVEVEPDHKEVFKNERIRVYIAFIRPGVETLYHRHDKDTLYVVLEGGKNYAYTLPGTKAGKYVLPRSISLRQKLTWLFTRTVYGWTALPKSAYVLMHNEGNPIIHKVRGAEDNPSDMRMMGIEFLKPGRRTESVSIGKEALPVDYEDKTVRVFRLNFPADLSRLGESLRFTGIVIALSNAVGIESASPGDSERQAHSLDEGDLIWCDGGTEITFTAPGGSESEALLIQM